MNLYIIKRLVGDTRIETSIKISQEVYFSAENVVLAGFSGEAELERLDAKNIYLLGGKNAISEDVEQKLQVANYNVKRIVGGNRYETSIEIVTESATKTDQVFLTNDGRSGSLADALAVGPVSGRYKLPILLTSKS